VRSRSDQRLDEVVALVARDGFTRQGAVETASPTALVFAYVCDSCEGRRWLTTRNRRLLDALTSAL
jgi:hypothetical protein